jgi:hypothetical protein
MGEREAILVCEVCGTQIMQASCCEGWCVDCCWSVTHPEYTLGLFCKSHRRKVGRDWHCKTWESDK